MYHYLTFLTTPAPLTMFRGIYKLPAGFYLGLSREGKITAKRYWDAVPGQSPAVATSRGWISKAASATTSTASQRACAARLPNE